MSEQTTVLPRDEFSVRRRELTDNPGAFAVGSRVDVADEYGNLTSWIVETFRADGKDTVFLQRINAAGGDRILLPPAVTAALSNQRDRVVGQARKRAARQGLATRRDRGDRIGNPEALRRARAGKRGK